MNDPTAEPTTPADEAKLMTAIVRLLDKADPPAQARITASAADRYRQTGKEEA